MKFLFYECNNPPQVCIYIPTNGSFSEVGRSYTFPAYSFFCYYSGFSTKVIWASEESDPGLKRELLFSCLLFGGLRRETASHHLQLDQFPRWPLHCSREGSLLDLTHLGLSLLTKLDQFMPDWDIRYDSLIPIIPIDLCAQTSLSQPVFALIFLAAVLVLPPRWMSLKK